MPDRQLADRHHREIRIKAQQNYELTASLWTYVQNELLGHLLLIFSVVL